MEKLLEEARALNLSSVSLHATAKGEPVYRKFGFSASKFPELKLEL